MPGPSSPVFLGWDRPFLAEVAARLIGTHGTDLSGWIVAVPGRRAARRLEEQLVARAGGALWSPRIVTAGRLTDALLQLSGVRATRLTRTLVWAEALRSMGGEALTALVAEPPADEDREGWWRLAEELRGLHGDLLAPEMRDFADVAAALPDRATAERRRWALLSRIQAGYRQRLERLGMLDPHDARRAEIDAGRVAAPAGGVVLAGVTELQGLLRATLDRLDAPVIPLVFAPESHAEGFDDRGAVRPRYWAEQSVPLPADGWEVADRPADQADRAIAVLSGLPRAPAPDEITLGVPDEQVSPFLLRALAAEGVPVCDGAGLPLADTPLARLVAATASWLATRSYRDFAALVRHPDLLAHLQDGTGLLATLDEWQSRSLPSEGPGSGLRAERWAPVSRARERLDALLGALTARRRVPLDTWTAAVRGWLAATVDDGQDPVLARLVSILEELETLPEPLARALDMKPAEALRLVHRLLVAGPPLQEQAEDGSALLLGWLELALDDAPVLIVTGFNDGRVPASRRGHAFLPDGLRGQLGLPDDEHRLARDVHLFSACLASRETVAVVSGRRTSENDPLLPSRLVFRCEDEQLPARVRRFVGDEPSPSEAAPPVEAVVGAEAASGAEAVEAPSAAEAASAPRTLPRADEHELLDGLAVTAFKLFLASPYEFYLKQVLRLESVDDEAWELDPRAFGNLAHLALERFGNSPIKDSTDVARIGEFLGEQVDVAVRSYGRHAAVAVQVEQLKRRLRRFAHDQAARAADGWRIEKTEWGPKTAVHLEVDGRPFKLRGKIDRIDRHPDGRWAIWDYKTGERGGHLAQARGRDGWRDLQLPLYRLLARELGLPDPDPEGAKQGGLFESDEPPAVLLGYVDLARRDADAGFHVASWTADEIAEAFEVARQVVRRIRAGDFFELGRFSKFDPALNAIAGRGLLVGRDGEASS